MLVDSSFLEALLAAGATVLILVLFPYCCYRVLRWARRGKKRAYVVGAALAPFFAFGNVADPDFRIVHEAKRIKNREDDDSGDPPDPDPQTLATHAPIVRRRSENSIRSKEVVVTPPKVARPAIVWLVTVVLGLTAVLNALALTWALLSDAVGASLVRESVSPIEWGSLYAMSALLLVSMAGLFRLRKSSIQLFCVYLAVGVALILWSTLLYGQRSYFDPRLTLFAGMPVAVGVLLYMFRLKNRGVLV